MKALHNLSLMPVHFGIIFICSIEEQNLSCTHFFRFVLNLDHRSHIEMKLSFSPFDKKGTTTHFMSCL